MGKTDTEIRNKILEILFEEKKKGNDVLKLRDIAANIGVDYPTQAIPNADFLQREYLIECSEGDYHINLTHEGQRRAEAGFGIPSFYTEDLSSKSNEELNDLLRDLSKRLATDAEPNSRHWDLLKEKIEQIKYEIDRRDKKKLSTREKIYLGLAVIGAVATVLSLVF